MPSNPAERRAAAGTWWLTPGVTPGETGTLWRLSVGYNYGWAVITGWYDNVQVFQIAVPLDTAATIADALETILMTVTPILGADAATVSIDTVATQVDVLDTVELLVEAV